MPPPTMAIFMSASPFTRARTRVYRARTQANIFTAK
jgi:hypothetical protein